MMNNLIGTEDATNTLSAKVIRDVDEYLKLDIEGQTLRDKKPWNVSSSQNEGNINAFSESSVPRFAVDGYGRWKQIGGSNRGSINDAFFNQIISPKSQDRKSREVQKVRKSTSSSFSNRTIAGKLSVDLKNLSGFRDDRNESRVFPENEALESTRKTISRSTTGQGYKHLSMSLRSNVFPGVGKEHWESSTKQTYVPKSLHNTRDIDNEFGIKKDSFMEWSEYDVYRQRLMKAWDKYITDMPKKEFTAPAPVVKKEKPKEALPPPKPTKKKTNNRKKETKETGKESNTNNETQQSHDPQPMRIEVKPAPSEDGFWDFYDKPFAQ